MGLLDFGGNIFLIWVCYSGTLLVTRTAASFEWNSQKEKALQQIRTAVQVALPLGPYDPADPMVFDVSVTDRNVVWSPGQTSMGEWQNRPLGFWSKALQSSVGNYSPFEKQLLPCYWTLVDNECLIMGY